jgi:hypothetical protein
MTANDMSFGSDLLMMSAINFQPTKTLKYALPDTSGLARASTTLQHHLSDPYEGYAMV